jgi:cytochrome c553
MQRRASYLRGQCAFLPHLCRLFLRALPAWVANVNARAILLRLRGVGFSRRAIETTQARPSQATPAIRIAEPHMTRPSPIAASLVLACLLALPAFAQTPAAPAAQPAAAAVQPKGDPARGEGLTFTCQGCHGVTGYKNAYPNYHVPRIGGQSEQYLFNALSEYRKGTRKHPTMQAQAQSFSEQDIADIAAFLSGLKP